eukprot:CAMPEP_0171460798 /NCGR_PEP_ID=MMETSP0945-20130129/5524_1 /TAXON_ID=109269 /ORGANISM="Vaucheria litorea, Strain CCMP2940" /LENGTH=217 /DNA_ID=CAMNT_0011987061 /DNA_START=52 /DNA_END=706 /DNA_ORIENTATION=+
MKSFRFFPSSALLLLAVVTTLHRSVAVCPDTGIYDWSNTYCCPDSCGTCGGDGCHLRPGGATSCCTSQITQACDVANLPCIATGEPTDEVTLPPSDCPDGSIADATGLNAVQSHVGSAVDSAATRALADSGLAALVRSLLYAPQASYRVLLMVKLNHRLILPLDVQLGALSMGTVTNAAMMPAEFVGGMAATSALAAQLPAVQAGLLLCARQASSLA